MYAVIATGGKQYRVQEGGIVRVEKLDAAEGASVEFSQVLLVGSAFRAQVVDVAEDSVVLECSGSAEKIAALAEALPLIVAQGGS